MHQNHSPELKKTMPRLKKKPQETTSSSTNQTMVVQKYPISVIHHPGKELVIADALSRAFALEKDSNSILEELK